jgi:prepilin-type N-terminal cleavage/methylation domain-containing protein
MRKMGCGPLKNRYRPALQSTEEPVSAHFFGSRHNAGFTLLELSVSLVLITVLCLLGFLASSGSLKSVDLTKRMTTLQEELRSTMRALSDEVQPAVKRARAGLELPTGAQELKIVNTSSPKAISYVVPTDMTGTHFSGVTTIQFESEDLPATGIENGQYGNGVLDSGEDTNADGLLTRRLVIIQPNGTKTVIGGSNHLANVTFGLSDDGSMLEVTMVATMRQETGDSAYRMLLYTLTSNIYLMN